LLESRSPSSRRPLRYGRRALRPGGDDPTCRFFPCGGCWPAGRHGSCCGRLQRQSAAIHPSAVTGRGPLGEQLGQQCQTIEALPVVDAFNVKPQVLPGTIQHIWRSSRRRQRRHAIWS
jgi:hypothetical protein